MNRLFILFLFLMVNTLLIGCSNTHPTSSIESIQPSQSPAKLKPKFIEAMYDDNYFWLYSGNLWYQDDNDQQNQILSTRSDISPKKINQQKKLAEQAIIHDADQIKKWIQVIFDSNQKSDLVKDFGLSPLMDTDPEHWEQSFINPYEHTCIIRLGREQYQLEYYLKDFTQGYVTIAFSNKENPNQDYFKKYKLSEVNTSKLRSFFDSLVAP